MKALQQVMVDSDLDTGPKRAGDKSLGGQTDATSTKVEVDANAPQDAVSFSFRDISYSIPVKNEPDARVLRDVSATVNEGEVLAIVGPSGAGKTILLDTLTFSKGPGAAAGEISLCGEKMTREMFVKQAIYVPREDNLWPTMTPRDHLEFAFKMYKPDLDAAQLAVEVNELLNVTGLTSCADTRAGGFLFKGDASKDAKDGKGSFVAPSANEAATFVARGGGPLRWRMKRPRTRSAVGRPATGPTSWAATCAFALWRGGELAAAKRASAAERASLSVP